MMINEIFYSIQGEGIRIGLPTLFVRTTGCNLRCTWCDTTYAYDAGTEMTLETVIDKIKRYSPESTGSIKSTKSIKHICITGGEPLLQTETPKLIERLLKLGYKVSLETNGSLNISEKLGALLDSNALLVSLDIKCPSSGMQDKMVFSNIGILRENDQLKFVIDEQDNNEDNDYEYAKDILERYQPSCNVIFMPLGGLDAKPLAEKVLRDSLPVRLLIQLHKYIWGQDARM